MRRALAVLILAIATGLGCATAPQSPAQAVYQIQGNYAAALQIAVTYKQLPSCAQPVRPMLCSEKGVVAQLQKADDVAYAALTAAQNTARTPGAGANLQTALTAAQQATAAFAAITSRLQVK